MAAANLVAKLQNAKALLKSSVNSLGPDREFDTLIRAIGESKSKQEEDRIMAAEIETLKQRLSDPKLDKARAREYMVRAIYCEMLGHDVSWAHVKALQFASEPSIHTKKVGEDAHVHASSTGAREEVVCLHARQPLHGVGPGLTSMLRSSKSKKYRRTSMQIRKAATPAVSPCHQNGI